MKRRNWGRSHGLRPHATTWLDAMLTGLSLTRPA